jgi:hypothetical protein
MVDLLGNDSSIQSCVSSSNFTWEKSRLIALGAEKLKAREFPMVLLQEEQSIVNDLIMINKIHRQDNYFHQKCLERIFLHIYTYIRRPIYHFT